MVTSKLAERFSAGSWSPSPRRRSAILGCGVFILHIALAASAPAAITSTGDVSPANLVSWTNTTTAHIGDPTSGTVTVNGGSNLLSQEGYIAWSPSYTGTVTVDGTGSTWTNGSGLYVGYEGNGTLQIQNGAQVTNSSGYAGYNPASTGSVVVTGSASTWRNTGTAYVGYSGTGSLTVENGGLVSGWNSYLGYNLNSSGSAVISGTGSTWNVSSLYVGFSGNGALRVDNGAQVSTLLKAYLGYNFGSSGNVVVSGSGSLWSNPFVLYIDYSGTGTSTLTVEKGGTVNVGTLFATLNDLRGDGTINATGTVADLDLLFDSAHGTHAQASFGAGGTLNVTADGRSTLGAGYRAAGTMTITDGQIIASGAGYLGYYGGSNGSAIISGTGSAWQNSGDLYIGNSGAGIMHVENSAQVSNANGYLGYDSASSGSAVISGSATTWTNNSNLYIGYSGAGTLRVENGGQLNNVKGYLGYNSASNGSVVVSGTGSLWRNFGLFSDLYVGYSGTGTLRIEDGAQVSNGNGYLGCNSDSSGSVVVSGAGSTWTNGGSLLIGYSGAGALRIENGGEVGSTYGRVGYNSDSSGRAVVSGAGSTWTMSGDLYVGGFGMGALMVENGGKITAKALHLNSPTSLLNLHIYGDQMMVLGDDATPGSLSSSGTVRFEGDPFLPAGSYTPIVDLKGRPMTWSGSGTYQALGGTWDGGNKQFIVSPVTPTASGSVANVNSRMRLLITDSVSGQQAGLSVGDVAAGTTLSARPMTPLEIAGISLDSGESVLSAWDFTTNLTGTNLISFDVGTDVSGLHVWHFASGQWTELGSSAISQRDGIVSLTVDSFSGYAVSGRAVPEPGTLAMLTTSVLGLLAYACRRRIPPYS